MNKWLEFAHERPHEFTIQYPNSPEYFQSHFKKPPVNPKSIFTGTSDLSLYLHLPFCSQKCSYCNFAVETNKNYMEEYVDAIMREYSRYSSIIEGPRTTIDSIDIGGGTPTLLPNNLLKIVLSRIEHLIPDNQPNFASIETTPGIASQNLDKMKMLVDYKFKRVSMGIQSGDPTVLKNVRREISDVELAAKNLHKAGFERINFDLIFGMQDQTMETWEADLKLAMSLSPTSITTYDCLYSREGRRLKNATIPSQEEYGEFYHRGYTILTDNGYYAEYGSVNFSKIATESGTSQYFENRILKGKSYIGLGNYATSMKNDIWYFNTAKVKDYIQLMKEDKSVVGDFYILPRLEVAAKYALSSLNYGFIDKKLFSNRIGWSLEELYPRELKIAIDEGWLKETASGWSLGYGEFRNMNMLRSLFYTKDAQRYMMDTHS